MTLFVSEKIVYNSFLCRRSASTSEERFGTFGARTSKRRWSAIRRCDMCVRLDTSGGERGERTLHSQQQGSNTRIAVSVTEFRKNRCPSLYFFPNFQLKFFLLLIRVRRRVQLFRFERKLFHARKLKL